MVKVTSGSTTIFIPAELIDRAEEIINSIA